VASNGAFDCLSHRTLRAQGVFSQPSLVRLSGKFLAAKGFSRVVGSAAIRIETGVLSVKLGFHNGLERHS
jgi:hypothetical protein